MGLTARTTMVFGPCWAVFSRVRMPKVSELLTKLLNLILKLTVHLCINTLFGYAQLLQLFNQYLHFFLFGDQQVLIGKNVGRQLFNAHTVLISYLLLDHSSFLFREFDLVFWVFRDQVLRNINFVDFDFRLDEGDGDNRVFC